MIIIQYNRVEEEKTILMMMLFAATVLVTLAVTTAPQLYNRIFLFSRFLFLNTVGLTHTRHNAAHIIPTTAAQSYVH